jgi:hypothetical protein
MNHVNTLIFIYHLSICFRRVSNKMNISTKVIKLSPKRALRNQPFSQPALLTWDFIF